MLGLESSWINPSGSFSNAEPWSQGPSPLSGRRLKLQSWNWPVTWVQGRARECPPPPTLMNVLNHIWVSLPGYIDKYSSKDFLRLWFLSLCLRSIFSVWVPYYAPGDKVSWLWQSSPSSSRPAGKCLWLCSCVPKNTFDYTLLVFNLPQDIPWTNGCGQRIVNTDASQNHRHWSTKIENWRKSPGKL